MDKRVADLQKERNISPAPPVVIGGALVIPKGLVSDLMQEPIPEDEQVDAATRKAIEMAGMHAVEQIEKELGYIPRDVSADNVGYDIESRIPNPEGTGNTLRFIEVKGRKKGADSVIVTKNEILSALNKPDNFILAIAEVDGNKTDVLYLMRPFENKPDRAEINKTLKITNLRANAQVILEKEVIIND